MVHTILLTADCFACVFMKLLWLETRELIQKVTKAGFVKINCPFLRENGNEKWLEEEYHSNQLNNDVLGFTKEYMYVCVFYFWKFLTF